MDNNYNHLKIYSSKKEECTGELNRKNVKKLRMFKMLNRIINLLWLLLWIYATVLSVKEGYENYYIYLGVVIGIPFLLTILDNVSLSKNFRSIKAEVIKIIAKAVVGIMLFLIFVSPSLLFMEIKGPTAVNINKSIFSNDKKMNLKKDYNILFVRVNEHNFSNYWRNKVISETYDNSKIINSAEIVSYNKDTLEINIKVLPSNLQVKYSSKDYSDELMYSFRSGSKENLVGIVKENFDIELDNVIIFDNKQFLDFAHNNLSNIDIAFTESGIKGNISDKPFVINSTYGNDSQDIDARYNLIKNILYSIYSKDEKNFQSIKQELSALADNKKIDFLEDSYHVYNKLIKIDNSFKNKNYSEYNLIPNSIYKKVFDSLKVNKNITAANIKNVFNSTYISLYEMQNKKDELKTMEIQLYSVLKGMNIKNSNIETFKNYKVNVLSQDIVNENIFIKNILSNNQIINTRTSKGNSSTNTTEANGSKQQQPTVNPQPVNPQPVDPQPVNPQPVDPQPVDPQPIDPQPIDPQPIDPQPIDPQPIDPQPVDPQPVDPQPAP